MKPILLHIGSFGLPSYFVMLGIGFLAATILGLRECEKAGISKAAFLDMCILIVIAGVFGARLMHVLAEEMPHDFFYSPLMHKGAATEAELLKLGAQDIEKIAGRGEPILLFYKRFPAQIFYLWKGGMAFYGGLILATLTAVGFMLLRKMPVLRTSDLIGYGLPLGLVFGRFGCFLNGCCFGHESHSAIAVQFPRGSAAYAELRNAGVVSGKELLTPEVLPSMLFEAGICLLIFLFLWTWLRPRKRFDGQIVFTFGILYPIARFLLEFTRGDNRGVYLGGALSSSQIVSIAVLAFSLAMYVILAARASRLRKV